MEKQSCSLCGKANHFVAKCAKSLAESKKRPQKFKWKKVNWLDDITESSYSYSEEILSMSLEHTANDGVMLKYKNKIFCHMEITNQLVKMQVN